MSSDFTGASGGSKAEISVPVYPSDGKRRNNRLFLSKRYTGRIGDRSIGMVEEDHPMAGTRTGTGRELQLRHGSTLPADILPSQGLRRLPAPLFILSQQLSLRPPFQSTITMFPLTMCWGVIAAEDTDCTWQRSNEGQDGLLTGSSNARS